MNKTFSAFLAGAAAALVVVFAARLAKPARTPGKTGPEVARVGSVVITADEVRQRLNETSPFIRARYTTLERKKEFLDNLIRNEVLAQEAVREGLDELPQVREQAKRAMIQELVRRQFEEKMTGADIPEAELRKYYDEHLDDYVKPERARVFHIFLPAKDAREKTEARRKAQALLKDIDQRESKGESNAFQSVAQKESRDVPTAALGGDLRFQTRDELATAYGTQLADAAFALKNPGEKSGVVETPAGVELLKLQVKAVALNRTFEESKEAVRGRVARERRSRDYDDFIKRLRDRTSVSVNDAELDRIQVEPLPASAQPVAIPQGQSNVVVK